MVRLNETIKLSIHDVQLKLTAGAFNRLKPILFHPPKNDVLPVSTIIRKWIKIEAPALVKMPIIGFIFFGSEYSGSNCPHN